MVASLIAGATVACTELPPGPTDEITAPGVLASSVSSAGERYLATSKTIIGGDVTRGSVASTHAGDGDPLTLEEVRDEDGQPRVHARWTFESVSARRLSAAGRGAAL